MIELDGAEGEGGGQVLRSALALSLATGTPFRISNIRAKRKRPGLRPQHLASVRAAAQIGNADVEGDERGSGELRFTPRGIHPGTWHFDVGTAGSAVLVLQTVLPPLLTASAPSTLTVDGGTHIPFAPPYEFLEHTYLPQVARMGPHLRARQIRPGFLPVGGGRIVIEVEPGPRLGSFTLLERGALRYRKATASVSRLPIHIAERELAVVRKKLRWSEDECVVAEIQRARSPGNAVVLEVVCEHVHEVFFAPGEIGVRAESVARRAVGEASRYLDTDVPVGEHLADQLLLPLALGGGGRFRTLSLSSHARTQIALIRRFLQVDVGVTDQGNGTVEVTVRGSGPA